VSMESATELIKRLNLSKDRVKALEAEGDTRREEHEKQVSRLRYEVYQDQIRELENKRDDEIKGLEDAYKSGEQSTTSEIHTAMSVVHQVERILDLLRVPKRSLREIDETAITHCGQNWRATPENNFKEALPYLFQGSRLQIRLFVVENKKPKNKYSLCALGDTVFSEELLKLEHSYGCPFSTDQQFRLMSTIRDSADVQELKTYADRKRGELVVRLKGDYDKVLADYEEVQKSYTANDFLALIVARCCCGYFTTILDGYAPKDRTCPRRQATMRTVL
jgi:hypothetical protein